MPMTFTLPSLRPTAPSPRPGTPSDPSVPKVPITSEKSETSKPKTQSTPNVAGVTPDEVFGIRDKPKVYPAELNKPLKEMCNRAPDPFVAGMIDVKGTICMVGSGTIELTITCRGGRARWRGKAAVEVLRRCRPYLVEPKILGQANLICDFEWKSFPGRGSSPEKIKYRAQIEELRSSLKADEWATPEKRRRRYLWLAGVLECLGYRESKGRIEVTTDRKVMDQLLKFGGNVYFVSGSSWRWYTYKKDGAELQRMVNQARRKVSRLIS